VSSPIWQPDPDRQVVRLGIGRAAIVEHDGIAGMLVGSCVGLFMFDPVKKVVAAAHVSLPSMSLSGDADLTDATAGKFGDAAPDHLLSLIERAGGSRSRTVVKMAGAACMFGNATASNGAARETIGELNAEAVRNSVIRLGLTLSASECGGSNGRKLFFDTRDGILRVVTVRGEMLEL
jgi:chemotaxis protein CheD